MPTATPIVDYATLQATIQDFLNRGDLAAQVPVFIQLAEASIKRRLPIKTVRATVTVNAAENLLPNDVSELRSVRLVTTTQYRDTPLKIKTPLELAELRAANNNAAGRPLYVSLAAGTLFVVPTPDQSYDAEVTYYQQIVPLSDTNTNNFVLAMAPDAYLFGALMQAAAFMEHDERIPVWEQKYEKAVTELIIQRDSQEYGAAPSQIRLPVVF